jgi:hypothetical protein
MNMPFIPNAVIIESNEHQDFLLNLLVQEERSERIDFMPEQSPSYWNAHFASLLQCMHNQVNLICSPMKLKNYPLWSIADLRAEMKNDFFSSLENYMINWGFQYFLVNFLNNPISRNISLALYKGLNEVYSPTFRQDLILSQFKISGKDSALSNFNLLSSLNVFPTNDQTFNYKYNIWENSDFAFILNNDLNEITGDAVAIFGEVEGNKGNKLLTNSFWDRKHPNCIFGIGVVSNKTIASQLNMSNRSYLNQFSTTPSILLSYVKTNSGYKIVVLIEQEHTIIKDFIDAMKFLRSIFLDGKSTHIFEQFSPAFSQAAYILRNGLHTPILLLLDQLVMDSAPQLLLDTNTNVTLNKIIQINR